MRMLRASGTTRCIEVTCMSRNWDEVMRKLRKCGLHIHSEAQAVSLAHSYGETIDTFVRIEM